MEEFELTPYHVKGKIEYDRIIKQFGLDIVDDELISRFKPPHKLILMKYFFAHRDLDKILDIFDNGGKIAIVSGRGASEHIHLAHTMLFKFVLDLQKQLNAFLFVPISEDEKFFAKQKLSFEDARKYAIENLIDIIALGLDRKNTEVMIDTLTMNAKIYAIAARAAKKLTMSTIKAVYGFTSDQNIGLHFFPAIQAAHILYPTIEYDLPSLVVISIDQDPHMRVARDVAPKLSVFKPAALESKFMKGLSGEEKMSASDPYSSIYVTDTDDEVKRKIHRAFTGGQPTIEEQRKYGGNPDICPVYEYNALFFDNYEQALNRYQQCKTGKLICGDCKKELTDRLIKFLSRHRERREKAKDKIDEFVDIDL